MRMTLIVLSTLVSSAAFSAEPKPQFNVQTDAVLYNGGPSLGNSDQVRWDFYKVDSAGGRSDDNVGGAYDATFEEKIPVGKYIAVAGLGNITREIPVEIKDGAVAQVKADFDAAQLTIVPKRSADSSDAETQSRVEVTQGSFKDSIYGSKQIYVPAGELTLKGTIGPASAEEKITVRAGEQVSHDLIIPSGVVVPTAAYKQGGRPVNTDDIRFDALSTKETLDGTRETLNGTYGVGKVMQMPAGDYIMRARLGKVTAEMPFTVTAGKRTDLSMNLDAGVLAISAPEAERIDITAITNDLQGKPEEVSGRYGVTHQDTLSPGEYSVKVTYDKKSNLEPKEVKATVKASERTEIKVTK